MSEYPKFPGDSKISGLRLPLDYSTPSREDPAAVRRRAWSLAQRRGNYILIMGVCVGPIIAAVIARLWVAGWSRPLDLFFAISLAIYGISMLVFGFLYGFASITTSKTPDFWGKVLLSGARLHIAIVLLTAIIVAIFATVRGTTGAIVLAIFCMLVNAAIVLSLVQMRRQIRRVLEAPSEEHGISSFS